jgi:hypothetical protein
MSSSSPTPSEQNRVRRIVEHLESSTPSSTKTSGKVSTKKFLHDDHSDGSSSLTSSPPVKRLARRDSNDTKQYDQTSNPYSFELNAIDVTNGCQRTIVDTTVSCV